MIVALEVGSEARDAGLDLFAGSRRIPHAVLDVESWDVSYLAVVLWQIVCNPFHSADHIIEPINGGVQVV